MAMTKDELKAMVDETIVANGQKGITAESLNNALTEIISAAGEGGGSGDGLLRVIVPDLLFFYPMFAETGNFTPAVWAEIKASAEGEDISVLDAAINEAFAHNAGVYKTIKEKAIAGEGCLVLLDQTPLGNAAAEFQYGTGSSIDNYIISTSQPACVLYQWIDFSETAEAAGSTDMEIMGLIPLTVDEEHLLQYPSYVAPVFQADGGLIFTLVNQTLYLPTDSSVVLTDEQKAQNSLTAKDLKDRITQVSDLILNKVSSDGTTVVKYSFADYSLGSTCIFKYFDGLNLMQASIVADTGETTVEVLGSLTAPTA